MICSDSPGQISIFFVHQWLFIIATSQNPPNSSGWPSVAWLSINNSHPALHNKVICKKEKWFRNFFHYKVICEQGKVILELFTPSTPKTKIYFFLLYRINYSNRFWYLAFLMNLNIEMAIMVLPVGYVTFFRLEDQLFGSNSIRKLSIRSICGKDHQDNFWKQTIQIIP